jgi:hypothetical protein
MYARGKSLVNYEYFYAISRVTPEPLDGYGFYDLRDGAMRGGAWDLEAIWNKNTLVNRRTTKKSTKNKVKYSGYLFDEFGPYVHEVREFDVKFDPSPVQYSKLYMSNYWDAAAVQYISNSFGAQFVIANISRNNAILSGDDSELFGASDPVAQQFLVLGRDLVVQDDQTVTAQDDNSIRIDGEIEVELTSEWLQTEEMAQDVVDWQKNHWSTGVDQLDIVIFGNPLIELGDVVDVDWPTEHMSPSTHKYFVIGVANEFQTGLATTVSLRRVS